VLGLLAVFLVATLRPVNLGALALAMTFVVGTLFAGEGVKEIYGGFPVELLVLLAGVTYLFAIAERNGTVLRVVHGSARLVAGRRALVPWAVFVLASLPAMAGALGSAGVAVLAPFALRLGERYDIDRRMIGLMVVHGAAAGNFSPLNVLGAIVQHSAAANGLALSVAYLFWANLAYNAALAAVIFVVFGGRQLVKGPKLVPVETPPPFGAEHACTLLALVAVAVAALGFGLSIGLAAFAAGALLQLAFPRSSAGAEQGIAWGVVLLVCGIVTYVAALQRYGTVEAVGTSLAGLGSPLASSLLLCGVGALTSAFASSAGILGAIVPLAAPFVAQGHVAPTGLLVALAISATVVDATPFSTVGALVVANASDEERPRVYRGLLLWGAAMVLSAPPITWLLFILPAASRP
jgi:di/tricarboxylate transporter